jgi:hypothetical protein
MRGILIFFWNILNQKIILFYLKKVGFDILWM